MSAYRIISLRVPISNLYLPAFSSAHRTHRPDLTHYPPYITPALQAAICLEKLDCQEI
ncbi:hypothetical protein ES288_A04G001700v1 [Gossypium darwinii]|uniref:Uncharacterized protein n=2 Tax=Gossypium TaxID=3633 RepID=A0A5D2QTC1_GOSTO|nr:hypothetical protein ES288_A04G001700v1 [Gossypium darwinii]TYI31686.1 hypothetical protein ES332_A04G002000v1 [Gossypium tomentosum]